MVRAKFRCLSVSRDYQGQADVRLAPVQGKSGEENKLFWQYTPSGEIRMTITNPAAFEQFVPGAFYYVDFTPTAE